MHGLQHERRAQLVDALGAQDANEHALHPARDLQHEQQTLV